MLPDPAAVGAVQRVLHFIPNMQIHLRCLSGRTIRLAAEESPFAEYFPALDGHQIVFEVGNPQQITVNAVIDNLTRSVCARIGNIFLFHPPARGREDLAIRALISHFAPDFEYPEPEPPPAWAPSVIAELPGVSEAEDCILRIDQQISALNTTRDSESKKKEMLERWAQLLWLDSVPLQDLVRDALLFIGLPTESTNPTGHTRDLVATYNQQTFLMEVTGSTDSIKVDKGRKLMQWILDSDSPGAVRGVLFGNAFRKEPPQNRPPTTNHKIFVTELEDMACRFEFALLDVRLLYKLVVAKLDGRGFSPDVISDHLRTNGIVEIPDASRFSIAG